MNKKLRLEQSVTSQHLGHLRRCGYVLTERAGKEIYYSVNYDRIREVQAIAGNLLPKPALN